MRLLCNSMLGPIFVEPGVNKDKRDIFIVWVCVEPLCGCGSGCRKLHVRYKCYVNELDTLSTEQVFWWPYEEEREYALNEMCTRDNNVWRSRCPMICFYAVEHHFVDRVARQFGKLQGIPFEENKSVITHLHGYSRRNNQDMSDWANKHHHWIALWNHIDTLVDSKNRPHNESAYQKYLVWYGQRYRLKLKPGWTRVFLMCVNDANVALSYPQGGALSERTLRTTVEKFKARFHKWALCFFATVLSPWTCL
ncbi:hypothetical protein D1007_33600 [Hordeum vulgare]|nr:hypothetical protein D1007_33600 [Hordeum vulgare]